MSFGRIASSDGSTYTEGARFDASQRFLVGSQTALATTATGTGQIQTETVSGSVRGISIIDQVVASNSPILNFMKSRSGAVGGFTAVASGDYLGATCFNAADGTQFLQAGFVAGKATAASSANSVSAQLAFATTNAGTSPTEWMWLNPSGTLMLGSSTETKNTRFTTKLALVSTNYTGLVMTTYSATVAAAPFVDFNRSRGAADQSMTAVVVEDYLGYLVFRGSDGTNFQTGAQIEVKALETFSPSTSSAKMIFSTVRTGSITPTTQMVLNPNASRSLGFYNAAGNNSLTLYTDGSAWGRTGNFVYAEAGYDLNIGTATAANVTSIGTGATETATFTNGVVGIRQWVVLLVTQSEITANSIFGKTLAKTEWVLVFPVTRLTSLQGVVSSQQTLTPQYFMGAQPLMVLELNEPL